MPGTESGNGDTRAGGKARRFRAAALVLIVLILFSSSFFSLRTKSSRSSQDSAKLLVDTMLRTRALYHEKRVSGSEVHTSFQARIRSLIRDLVRLADISPSPRTIRRLALTQYALDDPGWRSSLLRLRTIPGSGPTFDTERELALWRSILEAHVTRPEVADYARRLAALNLGWYHHLALEALYRNAGMARDADRQAEAADSSTARLLTVLNIAVLAALAGLFLVFRQAAAAFGRRRSKWDQFAKLPPPRQISTMPPVTAEQSDILYTAFIIYLATFAALRLVMTQVVGRFAGSFLAGLAPEEAVSIQLALAVAAILPSLCWLWMRGRAAGLKARQFGLTSTNLVQDIIWGIGGYAAALPLLYAASVISNWLFGGVQSPPHPVLAELAVTHSALYLMLMFIQLAILPPLSEELMFRGVFFRALNARMTIPAAVVLASILFALLHPQLPLGFLGIFILGLIFNLLYLYRGSLIPGMVAHALNNGVIFIFFVLLTAE